MPKVAEALQALYERPMVDWLLAAVVLGVHLESGRLDVLAWYDGAQVAAFYRTVASSIGLLVAVTSAAITLLMTSTHDRVASLRRAAGPRVIKLLWAAVRAMLLLLLVAILAVAVDPFAAGLDADRIVALAAPTWIRWVVEYFLLLATIRIVKAAQVYGRLLSIAAKPRRKVAEMPSDYRHAS